MKPDEDDVYTMTPLGYLILAVQRAADDLHGQGARSDRIALQLLTALARYHDEGGAGD